ncbi:putative Vacuolar-sorting protein SNF8 [Babesia divergens]|uniref:Vacuolar-sorting protein SNF8 n=1 Tax=Babesia divergens TaxID=32595 RepID=A0AAD9LLU3_BABDI|nr:putative Vacuolar-sorting protein SNF8 [Babesia divergens]
MRRGIGVSRTLNAQEKQEKWDILAEELAKESLETYSEIADEFRKKLRSFVGKYKKLIHDDPAFRLEFLEMCDLMGVDPLLQSSGQWARMLGLSSFYAELTVRVLDVCLQTRAMNGGCCEMTQMLEAFPKHLRITEADVMRCINTCAPFGENSIKTMRINDKTIILTSPLVMGNEHRQLFETAAALKRGITVEDVTELCGWPTQKVMGVLNYFIQQQVVWVDQADDNTYYWFACLF